MVFAFQNATVSELYNEDEDAKDFEAGAEVKTKNSESESANLRGLNRSEELSEPMLDSNIETSMVTVSGVQTEVRIIDKSKRAYDISVDAHRALEVVL